MKRKRWGKKHKDNRDWKEYNEKLVKRGEFYMNPRFLDNWLDEIGKMNRKKVGAAVYLSVFVDCVSCSVVEQGF